MNALRRYLIATAVIAMLFTPFAYQAGATAPGPKVSEVWSDDTKGNKHNLSSRAWPYNYSGSYIDPANTTVSNPNTKYKAQAVQDNPKGQQICIFCHTPHSANVDGGAPLWNRRFSTETFSRYSTQSSWLAIRHDTSAASYAQYGQPDGASKLCLSCHDGVALMGDVLNGGPIVMTDDVITGIASFKRSATGADKMKIGHHPVSFVYSFNVKEDINRFKTTSQWKWPIDASVSAYVKLDKNSKMQCTTCHNPHQNQSHDDVCYQGTETLPTVTCDTSNTRKVAPFWVSNTGSDAASDRDKACEGCHAVGGDPWMAPAQPWPSTP